MGLDTTHDCYNGGYGGFTFWRNEVAKAAGIPVGPVAGASLELPQIDWEPYSEANFLGEWQEDPEDILYILLVHSDCDGKIAHRHCAPLADRLEALIPDIPFTVSGARDYRFVTGRFVQGLRDAAAAGEDVEFG